MEIFQIVAKDAIVINTMNKIFTRKVISEDAKIVWEWWNDQTTRKMMKINEHVPWDDHLKWFNNTLNSEKRTLLISSLGDTQLGVVRFDFKEDGIYEVSINLNPQCRGQGYGKDILKSSINFFFAMNPNIIKLFAMFKIINIASKKTFLANNFILIGSPNINVNGLERFDKEVEEYCELIVNKNIRSCKSE